MKTWHAGAASEAPILEDGIATATRTPPICECLSDLHSVVGEELRLLAAKLQSLCEERRLTCLAITSALPGEGKSTASLGLAAALARAPGRRVLLIDADLRRPAIGAALGLPAATGLAEWLEGGLKQVPVRCIAPGDFFFLGAGQLQFDRPEILKSPLMETLVSSARSRFDLVILDTPPVLPVADTVLMQDLVDGFVLIARSRLTPRAAIAEALGRLPPAKVIGVVLNDHHEYTHSYLSHASERLGMTYGASLSRKPGPDD